MKKKELKNLLKDIIYSIGKGYFHHSLSNYDLKRISNSLSGKIGVNEEVMKDVIEDYLHENYN